MVFKKKFFFIALLGLLIIPCGVIFAQANPIVLEFPSYQAKEPGFSDWWTMNISKFEETHPGVKIKIVPSAGLDPHHQNLQIRYAAGNAPDLVQLSYRYYYRFAKEGWLEPLDNYIKKSDIKENWSPVLNSVGFGGKTYSIPLLAYAYGLFYNEAMFKAANVKVPTNIEELLVAAEKLTRDTNGDGRIDQFGWDLFVSESSSAYMAATWMLIGNGTHWTGKNGKPQLTSDPLVEKTMNQWRTVAKKGWTPQGLDDVSSRKHFMAGNAAMLVDGSWVSAMIANAAVNVKDNVRIARVPFKYIPSGPSNVIAISASISQERKDLAWEFIKQLTTLESQQAYSSLTGSPAPRKGAVTAEIAKKSPGMQVFADAQTNAADSILPKGYEVQFSAFSDVIVEGLMLMATTDAPTHDILVSMEKKLFSIK